MLNSVVLMGRLTADPELKYTPSNIAVTAFKIAVDRSYSGNNRERQTDFISVVAWRKTAEFITRYFTKGQMITVEGSIQTRNYEDKNGNRRTAVEVIADNASFCGDRRQNTLSGSGEIDESAFEEISDDDLPF